MILTEKILWRDLFSAKHYYPDMVKIVVDIEQNIMSAEAEWHSELANELQEQMESKWDLLWGANLYEEYGEIEYNSLINNKPPSEYHKGNRSSDIQDEEICAKVKNVIINWVKDDE